MATKTEILTQIKLVGSIPSEITDTVELIIPESDYVGFGNIKIVSSDFKATLDKTRTWKFQGNIAYGVKRTPSPEFLHEETVLNEMLNAVSLELLCELYHDTDSYYVFKAIESHVRNLYADKTPSHCTVSVSVNRQTVTRETAIKATCFYRTGEGTRVIGMGSNNKTLSDDEMGYRGENERELAHKSFTSDQVTLWVETLNI